jgi:hypothetical protein
MAQQMAQQMAQPICTTPKKPRTNTRIVPGAPRVANRKRVVVNNKMVVKRVLFPVIDGSTVSRE